MPFWDFPLSPENFGTRFWGENTGFRDLGNSLIYCGSEAAIQTVFAYDLHFHRQPSEVQLFSEVFVISAQDLVMMMIMVIMVMMVISFVVFESSCKCRYFLRAERSFAVHISCIFNQIPRAIFVHLPAAFRIPQHIHPGAVSP